MLLTFSATNYKSIKETQTLSMVGSSLKGPRDPIDVKFPDGEHGVLSTAIIYGSNASGKSNLVDALWFMVSMVLTSHGHTDPRNGLSHSFFRLDEDWKAKPTSFDVSFLIKGIRYDFGFSYNSEMILEEWLYSYPTGRQRKLYERSRVDVQFGSGMRGAKKTLAGFIKETSLFLSVATQNNHEELSVVTDFFRRIMVSNKISVGADFLNLTFADDEIDLRAIKFLELIGTGVSTAKQEAYDQPEELKSFLNSFHKALATQIEGFEVPLPKDKKIEVELGHKSNNGNIQYFKGDAESAGTRRLLILMNELLKVLDSGDIAIVDELDASLHTHAVEAIVDLFINPKINTKGAQLIATTHDTNLLNPSRLRRDEIWFAEKDDFGASHYFSLAEIKGRKGELFEKSYLQGRYGAVPSRFDSEDLNHVDCEMN